MRETLKSFHLPSLGDSQERARRSWRKVVTGDPDKKIRDFVKEVPQVKTMDKFAFTFGVGCICLSEYLALRQPLLFPQYYVLIICFLLTNRLVGTAL